MFGMAEGGEGLEGEALEDEAISPPKPDIRLTPAEKNTPEGAEANLDSIEHEQKVKPEDINSVSKSIQRFKTAVRKWYHSSDDLPPED